MVEILGDEEGLGDVLILMVVMVFERGVSASAAHHLGREGRQGKRLFAHHVQVEGVLVGSRVDGDGGWSALLPCLVYGFGFAVSVRRDRGWLLLQIDGLLFLPESHNAERLLAALEGAVLARAEVLAVSLAE